MTEGMWFVLGVIILAIGLFGIIVCVRASQQRKMQIDDDKLRLPRRSVFFHHPSGLWVISERKGKLERWSKGGFYYEVDAEAALYDDHQWEEWS